METSPSMQANTHLRQARIARNWRQADVADQLGTTVVTVKRWERGSHQPSVYYRIKLCELFAMSPQELGLGTTDTPDEEHLPDPSRELKLLHPEGEEESPISNAHISAALPPNPPPDLEKLSIYQKKKLPGTPASRAFAWARQHVWISILAGMLLPVLVLSTVMWIKNAEHHAASTASTIDPRSTIDPYRTGDTLAISDDLTSEGPNLSQWDTDSGPSSGKTHYCSFRNHAYDMSSDGLNYCEENARDFGDFVYQIQLTIIQGQTAGIAFRINDNAATYYIFQITVDGGFLIQRNDSSEIDTQLYEGISAAIHKGYGQPNILAVDANGSDLTFYINGSRVNHRVDNYYSSGPLGVIVGEQYTSQSAHTITEAAYNYARVWTSS